METLEPIVTKEYRLFDKDSLFYKGDDGRKKLYLETYGCQMNVADSELVASILQGEGFSLTEEFQEADLILLNTCAIRENAEQKVRNRLKQFHGQKRAKPELMVGVLGCMAEHLKEKLVQQEKIVDIVVGPDAYRDLPSLVREAESGQKAINVLLSREETYAEISPVRLASNGVSAFVSITRGCDNMCSFCVVPYTRGRERSRDPESILAEVRDLVERGYREVTLLGQNVDKYKWTAEGKEVLVNFAQLLERVALVSPELRVRFSTSYPQDMTDEVLHTMARHHNICKYIHLPVQAGNNRVLKLMRRGYTREWYLDRIAAIRRIVPDCAISTDIMTGFCSETDVEHLDTLDLMRQVRFDYAYMFKYSERPITYAAKKLADDVPEHEKKRRLKEIIDLQNEHSAQSNREDLGKTFEVLIEGDSKRSSNQLSGRNSQNKMVVFNKVEGLRPGQYVHVKINRCTSATLIGELVP